MGKCVGKSACDGPWFKHAETETELAPGKEKDAHEARTQIEFIFYKKPMSNKISILRRSALPEATKVSTMVAEIHSRWKNTWEGASTSTFENITKLVLDDLSSMGYNEQWRREILLKATRGYMRILKLQKKGETLRNRPEKMTQLKRRYKKLTGQKTGFKRLMK